MIIKSYLVRFVMQIQNGPISGSFSSLYGRGEGDTFIKQNSCPALRQKGGGQRLLWSAVNCFRLKIIFLLKWSVLGWHSLIPFSVKSRKLRGLLGLTSVSLFRNVTFPLGEIGAPVFHHIAGEVHVSSLGTILHGSSFSNQQPTGAKVGNPVATGSEVWPC